MSKEDAMAAGLYQVIGKEIDDAYMAELKKQIIHPEIIKEVADDIKIVYSPFHGTGNVPVRRILSELGFKHVYVVPEQELPDPDFTTLEYPNPEDPKALHTSMEELMGQMKDDPEKCYYRVQQEIYQFKDSWSDQQKLNLIAILSTF